MFDFDDYENLDDYTFAYPALEVLRHSYTTALKRSDKRLPPWEFKKFIIRHTKLRISHGFRKYREVEPEWESLYMLIQEIEKEFNNSTDSDALEKAVILFDQVLILYHEGNPLPPYLTT